MSVDPQGKVLYTCGADGFIKYYDIDHAREDSLLLNSFTPDCNVRCFPFGMPCPSKFRFFTE